jgi:hypothetical protein
VHLELPEGGAGRSSRPSLGAALQSGPTALRLFSRRLAQLGSCQLLRVRARRRARSPRRGRSAVHLELPDGGAGRVSRPKPQRELQQCRIPLLSLPFPSPSLRSQAGSSAAGILTDASGSDPSESAQAGARARCRASRALGRRSRAIQGAKPRCKTPRSALPPAIAVGSELEVV